MTAPNPTLVPGLDAETSGNSDGPENPDGSGGPVVEPATLQLLREVADEHGAAEFINKPVDFDLLKKQLQSLPGRAA